MMLQPGYYSLEETGSGVRLHAWSEDRSYSRRVVEVVERKPGRLELKIVRLGRPPGSILILDSANGRSVELRRKAAREFSREEFRLVLARAFAGWKVAELSTAPDLEHSLSPCYARALLRKGHQSVAAIQATEDALDVDGVLTFGLLWVQHLRRRDPRQAPGTLAVFLPAGQARNTALRIRHLDRHALQFRLFVTEDGNESEVDARDWGNLETSLEVPAQPAASVLKPEAELERTILKAVRALDAAIEPEPVYRQTPAIAGVDRGIVDLLAVDTRGRLAVLELKAAQDIHLPLQALDYWMRVRWHLDQGDFTRRGYFPGRHLQLAAPILYLVAPELEFHPTTDSLLPFLDRSIPIVRLGVGANWRDELKVVHRQERNGSHRAIA